MCNVFVTYKNNNMKTLILKTKLMLVALTVAFTIGNANVQTFVFTSAVGNNGRTAISIPEITQSVVTNDVVLGFIQANETGIVGLPYRNGTNTIIDGWYLVEEYSFQTYNENNAQIGFAADNLLNSFYAYRVIIIEASNVVVRPGNGAGKNQSFVKNGRKTVLEELSKAVNITDYCAVMNYYNLPCNE